MAEEENYFELLMKDNGFDSVDESFVRFLNKCIKKNELILHCKFDSIWPDYFLQDQNYSPVAFQIHGLVEIHGLSYEEVNRSILYDEMVAVGPIYYSSIYKSGSFYYPAIKEDPPFLPTEISDGVFAVSTENAPQIFVKTNRSPLKTENIILTKESYEKFKLSYELSLTKKTLPRRRVVLKEFLRQEGYDIGRKLLFSEHRYASRKQLWQRLYEFDPESRLFSHADHTTKDKIDKLFDGNPYISFDKNKTSE